MKYKATGRLTAKKTEHFKEGDLVTYYSVGAISYGKIKSICPDPDYAFVVFHCNNQWENWKEYTGQRTSIKLLKKGWQ